MILIPTRLRRVYKLRLVDSINYSYLYLRDLSSDPIYLLTELRNL